LSVAGGERRALRVPPARVAPPPELTRPPAAIVCTMDDGCASLSPLRTHAGCNGGGAGGVGHGIHVALVFLVSVPSPTVQGFARVVDDDCLVFYATYKSGLSLPLAPGGDGDGEGGGGAPGAAGPDVDVYDLIRLVGDDRRYRTWQVRRGGDIVKLVHVVERRVTADDPFIEM